MHCIVVVVVLLLNQFSVISTKECNSIEFRNTPKTGINEEKIKELKNCTSVVGFLQVLLMDSTTENHFNNLIFPLLREITGFLLFYRVRNLRNIGKMFPNLALIRGHMQIAGYSLIIYDMPDLEWIGLQNLLQIEQGAVRIENNPRLCDGNSFSWEILTIQQSHKKNVIAPLKKMCSCTHVSNCTIQKYIVPLPNLKNCNEKCLIGCDGQTEENCFACKLVKDNGVCKDVCPRDKYDFTTI